MAAHRKPMARPGHGNAGTPCDLYCNYFSVSLAKPVDVGQYDVTISYSDDQNGKPLIRKPVNRKVLAKLNKELGAVVFDGDKNLYSINPLPFQTKEFIVTLDRAQLQKTDGDDDDGAGKKRRTEGSTFKVRISFATKVDMQCLLQKEPVPRIQDALRVLDVLLREQAARMEYIQLRESYFHHTLGPVGDLGDGVLSWRGYHASFRRCAGGLTLNLDPSTTIVVKPQRVHEFISDYVRKRPEAFRAEDLTRAKRVLKGLEVQVYAGTKHKIFGFSDLPASQQSFERREKSKPDESFTTVTTTVEEYYLTKYKQKLTFPNLQCVDVGKASRSVFIPMEFCQILPGQRYRKKLNGNQVRKHMDEARQKPDQRMVVIKKGMSELLKNAEADLNTFNVKVDSRLVEVKGRVLPAPSLKFGRQDEVPGMGTWNFNRKTVARSAQILDWSVISFGRGGEQEARRIATELKQCCCSKGMNMNDPKHVVAEQPRNAGRTPYERVSSVRDELKAKLEKPPGFLLCILPQKDSDLYAPFKRMFLTQIGIVNQCVVPPRQLKDQYLTNVALKINAKCGGYNSVLTKEFAKQLPKLSEVPTMILGMDVSHGQTASGSPSLAALVGSRDWPRITLYAARVRTQQAKQEEIANIPDMLIDLVKEFTASQQNKLPPQQILIFRDGVSESQFDSVLSVELGQIIEACEKHGIRPKLTLVVCQKRHHTRFFPRQGSDNIRPGTVIDRVITHATNYDFFLSSHKGLIGTTRPTHYVVLYDEIGFTPDEMQNTVNQLCYTYVKSTTAVSIVSPVYYAHLAAQKARNFMSFDASESGSSHRGGDSSSQMGAESSHRGGRPVPEMPKLHDRVLNTMFFV